MPRLAAIFLMPAAALLLLASAASAADEAADRDRSLFELPLRARRRAAAGEAELGKMLFFDARLSRNGAMSCATCHNPSLGWSDGLRRGRGLGRQELDRRTPSLFNASLMTRFFWDGRAKDLDAVALDPIQNPHEMDQDLPGLVRKLSAVPDYARRFREVYGDGAVTAARASRALAAFIRQDAAVGPTPADRFDGDPTALSPAQIRGRALFLGKARCARCHFGPALSDNFFHRIGLPDDGRDPGRFAVTGDAAQRGAFRTSPLRNAALTPPYMHDGSLATLREVVEFYDRGGDEPRGLDPLIKPLKLTDEEKTDLLSYLDALSAPRKPVVLPVLPADAPQARAEAPAGAKAPCFATEEGVDERALRHFEFAAFAARDPEICAALKGVGAGGASAQSAETECRVAYHDLASASALITGARDFRSVCGKAMAFDYPELSKEESSRVCEVLEKKSADAAAACAELPLEPRWKDACIARFSALTGRSAPNPESLTGPEREWAEGLAAFRRARSPGGSCGGSELCEVLNGGAAASARRYADELRKSGCAVGGKGT